MATTQLARLEMNVTGERGNLLAEDSAVHFEDLDEYILPNCT